MSTRRIILEGPADVAGWRAAARTLLAAQISPHDVVWTTAQDGDDLFAAPDDVAAARSMEKAGSVAVPRAFLHLAETGLLHRDPERFGLFYRLLTHLAHDRRLMEDAADPDVVRARDLAKAVRRDKHKMTAFVRFRELVRPDGGWFVAWFEPEHHIVEATAPFFMRRFAAMRWSILTPERSAHWNGDELTFSDGARKADAPDDDALEGLWRTYYASIFNPARLKVAAMRSEMPRKYWRNLPEASLIGSLIASSAKLTAAMVDADASAPKKGHRPMPKPDAPAPPEAASLDALHAEVDACRACPLWGPATQAVFGEGPADARVVVVGEQPGDKEDIAGRPFVGPAGALFDKAAKEAGLEREKVYVTNAVKHFKFEPRGKFRLHKTPGPSEIAACRPWLDGEIATLKPRLVVAMGATAARAVFGRVVKVGEHRGRITRRDDGSDVLVTVHPSYLLRVPDEALRQQEYRRFVDDLSQVAPYLTAA